MHRTGLAGALHAGARKQNTSEDKRFKRKKQQHNHKHQNTPKVDNGGLIKKHELQDLPSHVNSQSFYGGSHHPQQQQQYGLGNSHISRDDSFMQNQSLVDNSDYRNQLNPGGKIGSQSDLYFNELLLQQSLKPNKMLSAVPLTNSLNDIDGDFEEEEENIDSFAKRSAKTQKTHQKSKFSNQYIEQKQKHQADAVEKQSSPKLGLHRHNVLVESHEPKTYHNPIDELRKRIRFMIEIEKKQVIILKKTVVYLYHDKVKIYALHSLFMFHGNNLVRRCSVWLVEWRIFDNFILFVIFINSVSLAAYDYSDRDAKTYRNQVLDVVGQFITGIFAFEGVLEIIVRGFIFSETAYLKDGWCIMDFVVIVSGLLEYFMTSVKLKSLRVLRALRPLRSITAIPSMKKLVSALIQSLPDFVNVGVFLIFIFALFAILGMHQYSGTFYNACRFHTTPETHNKWLIDESHQRMCTKSGYGNFICPADQYCGNPDEFPYLPLSEENVISKRYMYYGIHNFDDFGSAMLVVFQIVTAESWSTYMYNLMDVDQPFFAALYTIMIVVVGSFFLMNLILAVIIQAFIQITKKELDEEVLELENEEEQVRRLQESIIDTIMDHIEDQQYEEQVQMNKKSFFATYFCKRSQPQVIIDHEEQKPDLQDPSPNLHLFKRKQTVTKWKKEESPNNSPKRKGSKALNLSCSIQDVDEHNPIFVVDEQKILSLIPKQSSIVQKDSLSQKSRSIKYQDDSLDPDDIFNLNPQQKIDDQFKQNPHIQNRRDRDYSGELNQIDKVQINSKNYDKQQQDDEYGGRIGFLKDRGRQRKVANILSNINNKVPLANEELKNQDSLLESQSMIEEDSSRPLKQQESGVSTPGTNKQNGNSRSDAKKVTFAHTIAELSKISQSNYTNNGSETQLMGSEMLRKTAFDKAFQNFLEKQQEEDRKKNEFFSKVLDEDAKLNKQQTRLIIQKQCTLRTLATIRVKIQMKRQKTNLSKHYQRFKIEYRAEKNKLYNFAFKLTENKHFQSFITLAIIINTIFLSLDKYPDFDDTFDFLEHINAFFTLFFLLELLLKITGVGFKGYFREPNNCFDCIIVLSTIIDLLISSLLAKSTSGFIIALRSFRLLRLFKLAKQWKRLYHLLKTVARTLKDVSTFSILVFLFMFSFSLLGMELFAYRVRFNKDDKLDLVNGTSIDANFDNLMNSFATVFIVLTADGWSSIYFEHYRAVQNPAPTIYFIALIIVGQRVLLNLFLAMLLQNFDENALRESLQKELQQSLANAPQQTIQQISISQKLKQWILAKLGKFIKNDVKDDITNLDISSSELQVPQLTKQQVSSQEKRKMMNKSGQLSSSNIDLGFIEGCSLNIFSAKNIFRQKIFTFSNSKNFEFFMMLCIFLSAVQLALDSPLTQPEGQFQKNLFIIDSLTTALFALEAFMKILSYGFFFNGPSSYLKNTWNLLDFVVIILSIMALTPLSDSLRIFKMFRIMRVLRLVGRNESLKVGVKALLYAVPNIANVTVIMLFFFLLFGILCVSYFKGKFYHCISDHVDFDILLNDGIGNSFLQTKLFEIKNKWDCIISGGEWHNQQNTFDNIYEAILTLFIMATAAAWSNIMFLLVSTTEIDQVQVKMNNPIWLLFSVFYIVVSSFFLLNLFVGVVISTFNSEQDKLGGNDLLTDRQKEWIDGRLLVLRSSPIPKRIAPKNKFQRIFFLLQENKRFETFILASIVLNTLILGLKWYQQHEVMDTATEMLNYLFTGIFVMEALIKILGLGPKNYFKDSWNLFDFIIIIGSVLSIVLYFLSTVQIRGALTIIRAFRILRVVRLIKRAKSLNLIFNTFIITLPALANIGGLLLLLLFLYSILGVQIFGQVKRSGMLTQNLNFETFATAFCTLCAVATADSWGDIMNSAIRQRDVMFQCDQSPTYEDYVANGYQTVGCGAGGEGVLFFYSFYLFVNLIFLNLFIAIVLTGFQETQMKDQRLFNLEILQQFRTVWANFDPDATSFIMIYELRPFLFALGEPLGFTTQHRHSKYLQDKFIAGLELPTYDSFSKYQFLDVLDSLSLQLMVLDHTRQFLLKRRATLRQSDSLDSRSDIDNEEDQIKMDTEEQQDEIKAIIRKDINQLLFQQRAEEITAVKEVMRRELNAGPNDGQIKKDGELTSMHHAAAEVAVHRMKRFVSLKRQQKLRSMYASSDEVTNLAGKSPKLNQLETSQNKSLVELAISEKDEHLEESPEIFTHGRQKNQLISSQAVIWRDSNNLSSGMLGTPSAILEQQNSFSLSSYNSEPKYPMGSYSQALRNMPENQMPMERQPVMNYNRLIFSKLSESITMIPEEEKISEDSFTQDVQSTPQMCEDSREQHQRLSVEQTLFEQQNDHNKVIEESLMKDKMLWSNNSSIMKDQIKFDSKKDSNEQFFQSSDQEKKRETESLYFRDQSLPNNIAILESEPINNLAPRVIPQVKAQLKNKHKPLTPIKGAVALSSKYSKKDKLKERLPIEQLMTPMMPIQQTRTKSNPRASSTSKMLIYGVKRNNVVKIMEMQPSTPPENINKRGSMGGTGENNLYMLEDSEIRDAEFQAEIHQKVIPQDNLVSLREFGPGENEKHQPLQQVNEQMHNDFNQLMAERVRKRQMQRFIGSPKFQEQ